MRGLTQSALGARLGVTRSQVTLWETGGRNPSPNSMKALALALEVNLEWLVTGNGTATAPSQAFDGVDPVLHQMVVEAVASAFQKRGLDIRSNLFTSVVVTVYATASILWASAGSRDPERFREHLAGATEIALSA